MKYQKSMLKIYEMLVKQPLREFIIEELIKVTKVGRTSGFDAIKWLEKKRLIEITTKKKKKSIRLVLNETAINFKFFLDSLEIKNLSSNLLFPINLFAYLISKRAVYKDVDVILLFGSAVSSKNPNDIDLLIVCRNPPDNQEDFKHIRRLIENVCDIPINLHFNIETGIYNLFEKLEVYNKSYSADLLKLNDKSSKLKSEYAEALNNVNSIINNINDNELLPQLFHILITNLAYCNCWSENKINISKEEAIRSFKDKYVNKIKNFEKLNNISKFNAFKKITNEIGQKIFG